MRITQLRQADLNLLVVFTVLAEERNVSRAANRLSLTQPAVTRALQRLRETFHDDLLVRVSGSYEPTPKGERLLRELEVSLPRLDRLLAGADFDPATEEAHFRLAGTDYAANVVGIPLTKLFLSAGAKVSFEISPMSDTVFDAMERGRVDLLLQADDGSAPSHLQRAVVFEDDFVCVVAQESPYAETLNLKQYLDAQHVGVTTFAGAQTVPDKRLEDGGLKRNCVVRVPYFSTAIHAVAGTNLIATVPRRIAAWGRDNRSLRMVKAPKLMGRFRYLMTWHPRLDQDAAHLWLRDKVRTACAEI